jgi:hypothetical protein
MLETIINEFCEEEGVIEGNPLQFVVRHGLGLLLFGLSIANQSSCVRGNLLAS